MGIPIYNFRGTLWVVVFCVRYGIMDSSFTITGKRWISIAISAGFSSAVYINSANFGVARIITLLFDLFSYEESRYSH